jgi:hypothetical protein
VLSARQRNKLRWWPKVAGEKHHGAITKPFAIAGLIRAIGGYHGSFVVRCALRFSALTFQRPGEVRKAEWSEVDFEDALWRIPGERMKMRQEHIVPLFAAGSRVAARASSANWCGALSISECPHREPAVERERGLGRLAPDGLWGGRNDSTRLPLNGEHSAQ